MLLTLMCVSHSRGATYQINGAREVQGALDLWSLGSSKNAEPRFARAMLSRSLHSQCIFP